MKRRSFLAVAAGLAALGLQGCGSDDSQSGFLPNAGGSTAVSSGLNVSGRISNELVFAESVVASAFGPSVVSGTSFTTTISAATVGLLVLGEANGNPRAFTLTFPDQSPVFSAENSAISMVFMEPGFLRLNPSEANSLVTRIRAATAFAPLVSYLLTNSATDLSYLSGESAFASLLKALLQELGSPYPAPQPVSASRQGKTLVFTNPSPRFLRYTRDNPGPVTLPGFLSNNGQASDTSDGLSYTFQGLGPASTLPADTSLIESTYFPTLFFNVVVPLLELAIAQPVPVDAAFDIMNRLTKPTFDPRVALTSPTVLAATLSADAQGTIEDMVDFIRDSFEDLGKLITGVIYVVGLGFAITAILKYKQHENHPTDPGGDPDPERYLFLAGALTAISAILRLNGHELGDGSLLPT